MADRAQRLKNLAREINGWYNNGKWVNGIVPPDAMVLLMPEGYGKSYLVVHLVEHGFKVVFCSKSNAQLVEKEQSMREQWGLTTVRYVSKEHNLQVNLEALGIPSGDFKIVNYENENPYGAPIVNEPATLDALAAALARHQIDEDARELFEEHYTLYRAPQIDGMGASVVLITMAAFQALSTSKKKKWWERLGLVKGTRPLTIDDDNIDRLKRRHPAATIGEQLRVPVPYRKVAIIIDDPDRSDVDWLRGVSDKAAERLKAARKEVTKGQERREFPEYWERRFNKKNGARLARLAAKKNQDRRETELHSIIQFKGRSYAQRTLEATIGWRLKELKFRPKVIVSTTEWITGNFALQSLRRVGLNTVDRVEVFLTHDCTVTAVSSTITRKANHAVLLPIIEQLSEEFPEQKISLIADGLGSRLTLSSNKGRNDLAENDTVIKLSWPHPEITATVGAHFGDVANHDLMVATLLADVGNQAIGRNQGFRFRNHQAIVLIDPKYFRTIMAHGLIRYQLTPWSSQLPLFNKRTSKRALSVAYTTEQSLFEKRLLELIRDFASFGVSDEARALGNRLTVKQRTHYLKWLAAAGSPEMLRQEEQRIAERRRRNAESVRRHREKKRALREVASVAVDAASR